MPYTVSIDDTGSWLVIEYSGLVDEDTLVLARVEAVGANRDGRIRDFILDFTDATGLVLQPEGVSRIAAIDRERSSTVKSGRCALVAQRETVELGTSFLGAVSPMDLDFRTFRDRSQAEAWLRGELENPPPPLPRSRRK